MKISATLIMRYCVIALVGLAASPAAADLVLASASFENTAELGGQYTDTGDPLTDHDLVNNAGEAAVDTVGNAGDLAFDASYVNTRDDVGLTDGDFVGVTDFTGSGSPGSYTDGVQGYQISDADGRFDLVSAAVDISGQTDVDICLDMFVADTGFEGPSDFLRIYANVDGTETDLFFAVGDDLEGRGVWETLNLNVSGNSAFIGISFDSNAGTEAVYIDNVSFKAQTVPEPGSLGILAMFAGLGLVRRRK